MWDKQCRLERRDVFERNALRPFSKVSGSASGDSLKILKAAQFGGDRVFLYTRQRDQKSCKGRLFAEVGMCHCLETVLLIDLVIQLFGRWWMACEEGNINI
jgi:hypothetical protein